MTSDYTENRAIVVTGNRKQSISMSVALDVLGWEFIVTTPARHYERANRVRFRSIYYAFLRQI